MTISTRIILCLALISVYYVQDDLFVRCRGSRSTGTRYRPTHNNRPPPVNPVPQVNIPNMQDIWRNINLNRQYQGVPRPPPDAPDQGQKSPDIEDTGDTQNVPGQTSENQGTENSPESPFPLPPNIRLHNNLPGSPPILIQPNTGYSPGKSDSPDSPSSSVKQDSSGSIDPSSKDSDGDSASNGYKQWADSTDQDLTSTTKDKNTSFMDKIILIIVLLVGISTLLVIISIWLFVDDEGKRKLTQCYIRKSVKQGDFNKGSQITFTEEDNLLIDMNLLEVTVKKIEAGSFGYVDKGQLKNNLGNSSLVVAIKRSIIEGEKLSCKDKQDIIGEALIMKKLDHANVLSLIGIGFDNDAPLIVLPWMQNGSLRHYIRNHHVKCRQMIIFARGVAEGMNNLASKNMVHRDLAARNCLLDNQLRVKVSDFGMCKHIMNKDFYKSRTSTRLPKSMAIESIEWKTFNEKSDVWSYGVLLWELMTRGRGELYPHINDLNQLLQHLKSGNRLPLPKNTPPLVDNLCRHCWQQRPEERPDFSCVVQYLTFVEDIGFQAFDSTDTYVSIDSQRSLTLARKPLAKIRPR